MPSVDLDRSPGSSSFHSRFTDKMKMKLLKKSKNQLYTPPTVIEASESTDTSAESSSLSSSSSSSGATSQSTSITAPSIQSSASLSPPVTQQKERTRPKSELYSSSRRNSHISTAPSAGSTLPTSPYAPRLLSVQENQWVHQSLLLVFGQVGVPEKPCGGTVTVHHHLEGYPATQWPVSEGYFKALVRLDPGPNKLRFEYNSSKTPSFSTSLTVNMLPLAASPPLHLAVLLGKDSAGRFDCQGERQEHEGNGTEMAQKKLRMAAHLVQAFTAEQMYRNRLGRRCFRLEEEWDVDTLSNRATNSTMRNLAKVHVIRSEKTVDEIRRIEQTENGEALKQLVKQAVDKHFGSGFTAIKRYIAIVLIDAKGHLQFQGLSDESALNDGFGIIGSRSLYTLPSCIEEVVPSLSDCTRIGATADSPNATQSGFFWEAATLALGAMMEAFLSPQTPIEPRDFSKVNRTFVTKEPYSLKTKSPGLKLSLPQEECSWPRVDCLRFRYHPCFRLPTDPLPPPLPDTPQIYALENGIVVGASSGVALVLIYTGDTYRDYIEYTSKPEREVFLQEDVLRGKLSDVPKSATIKLKIYSAGQGESVIEDFHAAQKLSLPLPDKLGTAFKSSTGKFQEVFGEQNLVFDSLVAGRMLMGIRIFHNGFVDGLEFQYEDQSSQLFGRKGETSTDFPLDTRKGESLMGFQLRVDEVQKVKGIEILTSFGRRSPNYGSPDASAVTTLVAPRGRTIAGVAGMCGESLAGFTILYK